MASIDIGAGAISGPGVNSGDDTFLDKTNPANGTGSLDVAKIYPDETLSTATIATFYTDGGPTTFSARDRAVIGSVTGGAARTFSGLSIDVVTDDVLGLYSTGNMKYNVTGGLGVYFVANSDATASSAVEFSRWNTSYKYSIYATGATTPPATSIKAVNGVAYADIKAINGVAIGDIKSFNGVSNVA